MSSYGYSSTGPFNWSTVLVPVVPVYKHRRGIDLFTKEGMSDFSIVGGVMSPFSLLVSDLFPVDQLGHRSNNQKTVVWVRLSVYMQE